jgi:23S rRNA (adenine2030-N6)-methyltransferase
LHHPWAQKLAEYRDGIERIWLRSDAPASISPYLELVRRENPAGRLRWYPGSPRIASRLLRAGDRAELAELNRDDCQQLTNILAGDSRFHVHYMDGYQALKAHLPPRERRGLVLIDSSFDRQREFERLLEALQVSHRRWATGVFAVWYPLVEPAAVHGFERRISSSGIRKVLKLELTVLPEGWTDSLRGCAMLLVNPPFGIEQEASEILPWLKQALAHTDSARARVDWLVPE